MAPNDRYEFVHCMSDGIDRFTDILAPSPEDWQKVVELAKRFIRCDADPDRGAAADDALVDLAYAAAEAVRNMERATDDAD